MNRRNQLICLHAMAPFVVLVGGAFLVAGFLPPPSPHDSQRALAATFHNHLHVRIGAAMFFFGAGLFVAPCSVFTNQMRRIEGPFHALANVQIVSAAVGVIALQIPGALWLAISYRHGVAQSVTVTLNDVAWFFLLGAVGSAVMQNLAIGICILGGDGTIYPRWLAYLNLWLALGLMFGVFIPFFKTGPLAWNGVLGFWVVAASFFGWAIAMWICTAKAIDKPDPGVR
ncbi:MAG: hypothetical protein ACYDHH_33300 [Solirubrobacteraceae bacterium]